MTKFSNAENADFRKIVRILTSMMENVGAKVESNWSVEALRKRGASTLSLKLSVQSFTSDSTFCSTAVLGMCGPG